MANKYWNEQISNINQPQPTKVSKPNLSANGVITPSTAGGGPNLPGTGVFSHSGPGPKAPMAVIKGQAAGRPSLPSQGTIKK